MNTPAVFSFGGVNISCLNPASATNYFFSLVESVCGGYVVSSCTHGVVESQTDKALLAILNGARMNLPDGMPTVWMGKLQKRQVSRVTAPEFLELILSDARAKNIKHYFYGGSPQAIAGIVKRAGLVVGESAIVGAYSPPMRKAGDLEDVNVIEQIRIAAPDVIWVGLGLPKQEYWMANHTPLLPKSLMVGVGAAFDWFGGTQPRAPQLVQQIGLEWAYRLAHEPARLWPRYRTVVPKALKIMIKEALRRPSH